MHVGCPLSYRQMEHIFQQLLRAFGAVGIFGNFGNLLVNQGLHRVLCKVIALPYQLHQVGKFALVKSRRVTTQALHKICQDCWITVTHQHLHRIAHIAQGHKSTVQAQIALEHGEQLCIRLRRSAHIHERKAALLCQIERQVALAEQAVSHQNEPQSSAFHLLLLHRIVQLDRVEFSLGDQALAQLVIFG